MNFFQYINQINKFSFSDLTTKRTISEKLFYCRNHLKEIAKGSSRVVFDFDSSVIKVAKNQKGNEQNRTEIRIGLTKPDCVPNLISFDENFSWTVFEKVAPITKEEFEQLSQTTLTKLHDVLKYKKDRIRKDIPIDYSKENQIRNNKLLNELASLIESYDLSVGDMVRISSWGRKGNQVVLLDFGLTSEIYKKYYKK